MAGDFTKTFGEFERTERSFKKVSKYENKRTTVKVFKDTKAKIENIIGNDRNKSFIGEFTNAVDVYDVVYSELGDDVKDKADYVKKALEMYKKSQSK